MLLRPVSIGELAVNEAACCSIQRPSVILVVASSQQGQQGPGCIDHMGAVFRQLMVLLHHPANQLNDKAPKRSVYAVGHCKETGNDMLEVLRHSQCDWFHRG